MNHLDPTLLDPYVAALGDDAIASLAERELIRSVDTPTFAPIDPALLADRIAATVAGLTLGDVFAARFRRSRARRRHGPHRCPPLARCPPPRHRAAASRRRARCS